MGKALPNVSAGPPGNPVVGPDATAPLAGRVLMR
jgi:hypothetical protein